jgi:hypothetical protein
LIRNHNGSEKRICFSVNVKIFCIKLFDNIFLDLPEKKPEHTHRAGILPVFEGVPDFSASISSD